VTADSGGGSLYAPIEHEHAISAIAGLQTALDGKQPVGSYVTTVNFTWTNLTGKPTSVSAFVNDVGYLTSFTETDPVFAASPAGAITAGNVSNWNTAYSWGNHASAGYLTNYTETDPVFAASAAAGVTTAKISNWDAAHGWGNHASAGYLSSGAIGVTVQAYDPDLVNWAGKTAPTGDAVGTTDAQTLTNKTLSKPVLNDGYTEEVFAITDGATVNLDPNNGSIQTWTLGASRTPGQANWASGQSITLMIDDGTAYSITWTTLGVVWKTGGGTAPTLNATGFTVITLWKVGTTIYGARVGDA